MALVLLVRQRTRHGLGRERPACLIGCDGIIGSSPTAVNGIKRRCSAAAGLVNGAVRGSIRPSSSQVTVVTEPGLLPGAGRGPVAVQDLRLVLVPRGGGAVGVDDQGPAPPVYDDLVVERAQQDAVLLGTWQAT